MHVGWLSGVINDDDDDEMAPWIKMPLGMEVGLSPGDFVLDGDPTPPKEGTAPSTQFSVHAYCGQMSGWIKKPLGMEIGFGLCDIDRRKTNSPQRRTTPNFRPVSIVAKRLDASRCHFVWRQASAQANLC